MKSPKKTPVKKKDKSENSDDEYKPSKSRKITPRKELNYENTGAESNIGKLNVKTESEEKENKKSPRKRKVTPKKVEQVNPEDDIDDFELKADQLSVKSAPRKKVTPNKKTKDKETTSADNLDIKPEAKKKVTPNKKIKAEEINSQDNLDDFVAKIDNLNIKPAPKKRVTPNKKAKAEENNSEVKLDVKTAPKKKVTPNKKAKITDQNTDSDKINNEQKKTATKKENASENSDANLEFKEPTTRNTKSRVESNVLLTTDTSKPKTTVTRKSPRNKEVIIEAETANANSDSVVQKKARINKK